MTIATEPTEQPIEPTDLREVPQDEAEQLVDEPVGDEPVGDEPVGDEAEE